jgi:hypothetical protein
MHPLASQTRNLEPWAVGIAAGFLGWWDQIFETPQATVMFLTGIAGLFLMVRRSYLNELRIKAQEQRLRRLARLPAIADLLDEEQDA